MAASNQDDFFGVGMSGANPYASRYQPVHTMAMEKAQTQAKTQPQIQNTTPQGSNASLQGGQLNAPRASTMAYTPTGNQLTQQQILSMFPGGVTQQNLQNALPALNASGIHLQNEARGDLRPRMQMPDGTTVDLGAYGRPAEWQDRGDLGNWHAMGGTRDENGNWIGGAAELGQTVPRVPNGGANADSIPQDLATLREYLQNYYLGALNQGGRFDPSFTREELTVPLDPSWGRLNDSMYGQLGLSNDATGRGLGMLGGLFGQGAVQADIGPWQDMAKQGGSALLGMAQSGGNFNPLYQNMITGGAGWNALNSAAGNPSNIDPNLLRMAQSGVGMGALQRMAQTGGRSDINPQLDAIRSQGMMAMEDQLAQIREQYGQMGLGAGSDISDALGRGVSRGMGDIIRQQSELAYGADEAAQMRMLQAGGMEQGAMAGLMGTTGQLNLGGRQLAVQAGDMQNNAILGMGGLWNDAQNRSLSALSGLSGMVSAGGNLGLGNAQLGQDWRNTQAGIGQAYMNNPYASNMAALTPGLGMYPNAAQQNAESNMNRWYNEQIRYAMGPPILGQASGYAGNYSNLNQPMPQQNPWMQVAGMGAGIIGNMALGGVFSSRDLKEDIEPTENILTKLKGLPMFTWRYKGDSVKHIGPMAQDFQKTFGVGDGLTLQFGDMLSVIMGGLKEMANAQPAH